MKVLTAMLATLALAACGEPRKAPATAAEDKSGPVETAADRDDCTVDEDCALVEACCGCSAGGRKVGIRADSVAGYEQSRAHRCAASACPQMISEHPSCNAEPVCKKGHCRAQAHMNQAPVAPLPPATTTP
ncbi:MAG: hypothetical protein NT062_10125 [Proteobacteria bacterium]|nr:hypothetical protein [Pseudomonadota bacterium]